MRKELLIWLVLLYGVTLAAAPVSQEEARQKALSFVNGRSPLNARGHQVARQLQVALGTDNYYVFNVGADGGFVIVSGDDNTTEILGYADSGHFDATNMPENMRAWLQGYADEMGRVRELQSSSKPQRAFRRNIPPMITTRWDQLRPYNNLCPRFLRSNNTCVTGCVATAMAQLMYYHRWPNAVKTDIPSYYCATNWTGYGHISVKGVAAGTPIHWDDMLPVYPAYDSSQREEILPAQEQAANQAVAELMAYCGRSVKMDYRDVANNGSTASLYSVVNALVRYFDYDAATEYVTRTHYSTADWENLIYGELEARRPVFYHGSTVTGAHAFIVDGFEDGYFHVNWGWSGDQDCYVLLSVMNPNDNSGAGASDSGDGYSINQGAVVKAQKNLGTVDTTPVVLETYDIKTTGSTQLKRGRDGNFHVGMSLSALNSAGASNTFDIGIGVYDTNGTLLYALPLTQCELEGGVYISNLVGNLSFGKGWEDGLYVITGISSLSTDDRWLMNLHSDQKNYVASISGDQLELIELTVNLTATTMVVVGEKQTNTPLQLKAVIQNAGTAFNNYLYLLVNDEAVAGKIFEVGYDATAMFDIDFMLTEPGVYTLKLATDKEGTEVIGTLADVAIVGDGSTAGSDNVELTFDTRFNSVITEGEKYILGNKLRAVVTATNDTDEDYYGQCALLLYTWEHGKANGNGFYKPLIVRAHATADVAFDYDVAIGGVYSIALAYQVDGNLVWPGRETMAYDRYEAKPAVVVIDQEGVETYELATAHYAVPTCAQVLDLRGQSVVNAVVPNDNPNCLYLIDVDGAVPDGLTKNVVKGQTAAQIELVDDGRHGFLSPIDFTADRIAYSRTFTQGLTENGYGWSTIVLPFDVAEVEADGRRIDWFRSSTDTDKDFWLYTFSNDDLASVGFVHAEEHFANVPYIISVPGKAWGEAYNLVGKPLTFKAENARISHSAKSIMGGEYYRFCGAMKSCTVDDAFVMNADGSDFVRDVSVDVSPFRCYFTEIAGSTAAMSLGIVIHDEITTAILRQPEASGAADAIYNLQGVRVGSMDQLGRLPKGVYFTGGRKIIQAK